MGIKNFKFLSKVEPTFLREEDVTIPPLRSDEWWNDRDVVEAINRQNIEREQENRVQNLLNTISRMQQRIDEQDETIQRQASRIYPTQVQRIRTEIAITEEQLEAMHLVSNETNDVHTILKRDLLNKMTQELLNSSFLDMTIRREEGFSSIVHARMDLKVQLPDSVIREFPNN